MQRILLVIFLLFMEGFTTVQAQPGNQKEKLYELNDKLAKIYNYPFPNIDTSYINYRKEANELIKLDDPQLQGNGYKTLALLELYSNHYNQAIQYFKKALESDSTCFICHTKLHWLYFYQKNDYSSSASLRKIANRRFESILSTDTTDINNWVKLYNIYSLYESTQPKQVAKRMDYIAWKLVAMDSANAYYWWQYSFHQHNNVNGEEHCLQKAVELNPEEDIYWNALAYFYTSHKNINRLKEVLEAARPGDKDDMHYWYQQKAHYYYELGLKQEALEIYKEAKAKGYTIVYKN